MQKMSWTGRLRWPPCLCFLHIGTPWAFPMSLQGVVSRSWQASNVAAPTPIDGSYRDVNEARNNEPWMRGGRMLITCSSQHDRASVHAPLAGSCEDKYELSYPWRCRNLQHKQGTLHLQTSLQRRWESDEAVHLPREDHRCQQLGTLDIIWVLTGTIRTHNDLHAKWEVARVTWLYDMPSCRNDQSSRSAKAHWHILQHIAHHLNPDCMFFTPLGFNSVTESSLLSFIAFNNFDQNVCPRYNAICLSFRRAFCKGQIFCLLCRVYHSWISIDGVWDLKWGRWRQLGRTRNTQKVDGDEQMQAHNSKDETDDVSIEEITYYGPLLLNKKFAIFFLWWLNLKTYDREHINRWRVY